MGGHPSSRSNRQETCSWLALVRHPDEGRISLRFVATVSPGAHGLPARCFLRQHDGVTRGRKRPIVGCCQPVTKLPARQPIMIEAALVLTETTSGMIDASATRSPSTPRTRSSGSTTASGPLPIRQLPAGWNQVLTVVAT